MVRVCVLSCDFGWRVCWLGCVGGACWGCASCWGVGAGNSAVVVDLPRCGPMLSPRVPNLVPIPGPRMERETPGQRPRPNYGHPHPGPGLLCALAAAEEQHIGLHALGIEDARRQAQQGVDLAVVQQLGGGASSQRCTRPRRGRESCGCRKLLHGGGTAYFEQADAESSLHRSLELLVAGPRMKSLETSLGFTQAVGWLVGGLDLEHGEDDVAAAAGGNTPRGHLCDRGLQPYPPRRATSPDTATPEPLNKVKGLLRRTWPGARWPI